MNRTCILSALAISVVLASGCPKKPDNTQEPKKEPVTEPDKKQEPVPGALAPDKEYASGKVQVARLAVETRVDVPNMGPQGKVGDDVKKAQQGSAIAQTMVVSEDRGKTVFTTKNFYVPLGTELRYNPAQKKYVLADPNKKMFWAMTGAEIGNLLEGGPSMTRTNYTINITQTQDKETIAGVEAVRSDAALGFDWAVKTRSGEKKGSIKVKLAIWHSADPKLKAGWGKMMVDFLTVPFQDAEGQKVVDELKRKVGFPVKWSMEVDNQGQAREKGDVNPKLLSVATSLEVAEIDRTELASPPAGFAPATGPYEFGEGGQTVGEDLLGKIPAKKGEPPKNLEPPDEGKQ